MQDYTTRSVRSSAVLTGSYVAGTVLTDIHLYNQLILEINFTIGSLTSAEVKIEFSRDNSTFIQETFQSIAAGTATETLGIHQISATGVYTIAIPIKYRYAKISVKGTGTVTSSLMDITAIIGVA